MKLEEVARRAKVSTATVSRVVNETGLVKSSTRARVMKAIADLNYHPNLHARTLAGGKSRTLGMIVSNLENPFFLDIFRSLELMAHARAYEVVVANTDYDAGQLVKSVHLMIGRRVAGLAVIVSEMDPELIEQLTNSSIPVVFYDVGAARPNITNVRVNYRKGMEKAVGYLHALGHHRIGLVGHHSVLGPIHDRQQCVFDMAVRFVPKLDVRHVVNTDSFEGGRQAARELLRTSPDVTAIMCVNDFMAIGVMRELREQGVRVPGDISITGFDNIRLAEFCYPPLTTIHIPRDAIGKMVFESLVAEPTRDLPAGRELVVDPELVVRESTGPAKVRSATLSAPR